MDTIKKVPEIRFEGFYDEWEKKRVKEFAKIIGGGTPSTLNIQYWNGEINWYTPAEIDGKRYVGFSERKITHLGLQSCSATILPALKTVLFTSRAGIGKTAILKTDACTNQGFQSLVLNDSINADFIYSLSKKIKLEAEKIASGSTFTEISGKKLSEISVFLATEEEQFLVGNVFKKLDEKLELEKEKHEKLINYKKAMLEDMFPKEGEKVPKIRFEGFDSEWTNYQLKDLGQKYTSLTGKTKNDFGHGDGRYVTFSNILANPVSSLDGVDKIEIDNSQNTVRFGDLFFNISSETYDEVGMSSVWTHDVENYYLNSFCMGVRPSVKINNHFITYLLRSRSVRKQIMKLAQGISRINISQTKMMDISLQIPFPEEQNLIGNFFKNLDEKIELSEKKIVKIENFKKAMLEKMFV